MKTKEELNALKEEVETLNKKLAELTDDELAQVTGGANEIVANAALQVSDNALQKVLDKEAVVGAARNRLEFTINNHTITSENVQAAESAIRDADMAKEMTEYTKNNILSNTAKAMLEQANQLAHGAQSLIK